MDKAFQRERSFGSLAQLVEQRTFNPWVVGSNPTRPIQNTQSGNDFVAALFRFSLELFRLATNTQRHSQRRVNKKKRARHQMPLKAGLESLRHSVVIE
jgi:hypothetical protein